MTEKLLAWFGRYHRQLPWRKAKNPYRIWISEVMLQQTQVKTALPYFERWLSRFPTLKHLAEAPLDDVLKAWEGLGYYRRARLLHRAAKAVMEDHGGVIPGDYAGLLRLPGIGPYTAAAIASIAFGKDELAIDGNVRRVAARLFRIAGTVKDSEVAEHLEPVLPEARAGAFNEALMELGALVCLPTSPRCEACPLKLECQAFRHRVVDEFPQASPRKAVPHHERYALVYAKGKSVYLKRRAESEMLGGLWGFPLTETAPPGQVLEPVRHAYTHFKISVTPILVTTPPFSGGQALKPESELKTLALSKLDHKILGRWRENFAGGAERARVRYTDERP